MRWVAGLALLLAGVAFAITLYAGSPSAAVAWLRGESLSVADPYLDFGTGQAGDHLEASATIRNWTDQPVRVIGGTSDCSCTTLTDLPCTIPPGGEAAIPIQFRVPVSNAGQLTRTVFLRTDYPGQREVRFRVGCRVARSDQE